ncbi:MAG: methyltransferase domain-containing protein [Eggerthellaceae bacterium]|nr:methyltransferase domain-containing protein [Eggerthellaceae bacterium]
MCSAGSRRQGARRSAGASPARLAALEVVRISRERDAFAQEVISKHIDNSSMSREDRAFATLLVLGVVSSRGALDDVLNRCMNSPKDVKDDVRDALQISTYEIIYLDKSPHAAVDQGVELVRSVAPKASGLANSVLRKVVKAKESFPFGDPRSDLAAYSRLVAFPAWLVEMVMRILGPQAAHEYFMASNEPAPVFVAVNSLKTSDDSVLAVLEDAKAQPQAAGAGGLQVEGCYLLNSGSVLVDGRVARMLNRGDMLVSDAASQAVASLVLPDQGQAAPRSVLEIGAGRGTKTILLQSNAQRRWGSQIQRYLTLDNHRFKTKLLEERAERYGVHVSEALTGDATKLDEVLGDESFDLIFIDAPCTGLGTLRRHPEIRWRLKPETIKEYASLGLNMLKSAASHVNVGGTLAYATCTITDEEDVEVVKAFLRCAEGQSFRLVPIGGRSSFASNLTSRGSDAHFAVKMIKLN